MSEKITDMIGNLRFLINENAIHTEYKKPEHVLMFARIDENYLTGRPKLLFYGETEPSNKKYHYLSSYKPRPNEIVMLSKLGNNIVIIGYVKPRGKVTA